MTYSMLGRWVNPTGTTNPDPQDPDPQVPDPTNLKGLITGIGPRSAGSISGRQADLGFVVADCHWSALQPTEGGPIDTDTGPGAPTLGWKQIETAKASGLPIRLRIHAGDEAPTWAKNTGGAQMFLLITERKPGDTTPEGTTGFYCGRWWTSGYQAAWADMMGKMAALLDNDPQIREVASHPSNTHYAEPFQRGTNPMVNNIPVGEPGRENFGKTNIQVMYETMVASGRSPADSTVALNASGAIVGPVKADADSMLWPFALVTVGGVTMTRWEQMGWKKTRYYLAFNPFQQWKVTNPSPANFVASVAADPADWTRTAMSLIGTNMGKRVIMGNNSLRVPLGIIGPSYPQMYQDLKNTPQATGFQTATQDIILKRYKEITGGAAASNATNAQALSAVIDAGLGIMSSPNDTPPGFPNNHMLTAPVTRLRARSIELPPGWQSHLTNSAQCQSWNDYAATNTIGA